MCCKCNLLVVNYRFKKVYWGFIYIYIYIYINIYIYTYIYIYIYIYIYYMLNLNNDRHMHIYLPLHAVRGHPEDEESFLLLLASKI